MPSLLRKLWWDCGTYVSATILPEVLLRMSWEASFLLSYDTDGAGSTAICTEVMTRVGEETRPFLRKL